MVLTGGRVRALSLSKATGTPKTNVPRAVLRANWGMEGDAHAGTGHRQISLLAWESIAKIRALGADVAPGAFAENITTTGINLLALKIGDRLQIGECELEITQIGKECHSRCAIFEQVGDCVMPREGLFARVLVGGTIEPGDPIAIPPVDREIQGVGSVFVEPG